MVKVTWICFHGTNNASIYILLFNGKSSHSRIALGYAGVYLIFLFFIQNIHCGYSLEPPRRGASNVYPQCLF